MTKDIAIRLAPHHKKGMLRAARQAGECLSNDLNHCFKRLKGRDWKSRHDRKYLLWMTEKELLIECYHIINPN